MTAEISTEHRLIESVLEVNRAGMKAKLRLLQVDREKRAFSELEQLGQTPGTRGSSAGQSMMADKIREVAYDVGLKMIDACLEV